jgi:hypothetical protein
MTWAERERFIHDLYACWAARFPDVADRWVHQSEDGTRIWLTDGEHGPVLAMVALPAQEATDDR